MRNPGNGITDVAGPLRARAPVRGMEPLATSPEGRTCAAQGCSTTLSVYNRGARCWQHEDRRPFTTQAPRGEPATTHDDEVLALITAGDRRAPRSATA